MAQKTGRLSSEAGDGGCRSSAPYSNPSRRTGATMATTLDTGHQWDAPNGSAPRQWIAVEGLISYGQNRRGDRVPMDGQRLASLSPDR